MGKKKILLDLIILVFLIVVYHTNRFGCDKSIILWCLVICAWELVTIILTVHQFKIRPVTIFLLSFWIVNCQFYLDLLVGLLSPDSYVFEDPRLINIGVILSALAFTSFSIGYKVTSNYKTKETFRSSYKRSINDFLVAFQVFSFLWWLSTLTAADFSGANYASSGAYDKGNSITGYAEVFFVTSQILSLSYFMKKEGDSKSFFHLMSEVSWLILVTSGLYVIIRLMSGDRGGAMYTAILYFFVYLYKTKKRIGLLPFVAIVLVGAIVVTSIGLTRLNYTNLSIKERLTYSINNQGTINNKTLSPYTSELAYSVHCTHVALEQTELHGQPYMYGLFHACYLLKFIPIAGNYITFNILGLPTYMQSSSEYVTVASKGAYYQAGLGTSTIADDYLEFGFIGVIVGLFVIGLFFKKIDTCLLFSDIRKTPFRMITLVLVLSYGALYIPRGIFFMFLRNWFYAMVVYTIVKYVFVRSR